MPTALITVLIEADTTLNPNLKSNIPFANIMEMVDAEIHKKLKDLTIKCNAIGANQNLIIGPEFKINSCSVVDAVVQDPSEKEEEEDEEIDESEPVVNATDNGKVKL